MKLYKVPNKTWVKVSKKDKVPVASTPVEQDTVVFFDHIDGMYSYCLTKEDELVHLAAWTEVEIVEQT